MTLKLAIIRHAKSTWDYGTISDFDRPLKESGIINGIEIAKKLITKKIVPSLLISSPAIRAIHTALIIAREMNYPCENISINQSLYTDSEEIILKLIKSTDERFHNLFIFGHNPTFTYLSNYFLKQEIENIPTAGVVLLDFNVSDWSEISKKTAVSEMFIFPNKLK
jgi:phosphohistidine phosphatase